MKKLAPLLILIFLPVLGFCCINDEHVDGETLLPLKVGLHELGAKYDLSDTPSLRRALDQAENTYRYTKAWNEYTNYGVLLILNGRLKEAEQVFIALERHAPGTYTTAANTGTLYELMGRDEDALRWIRRAVNINPASHDSSEWIHIKILEAKVAAHGNPAYFLTHSVLGLDFGNDAVPHYHGRRDAYGLHEQLLYQLQERMSFVRPEDPVVARLLFDLANLSATMSVSAPDIIRTGEALKMAKKYGLKSPVLDRRIAYNDSLQNAIAPQEKYTELNSSAAADTITHHYDAAPEPNSKSINTDALLIVSITVLVVISAITLLKKTGA